MLTVAWVLTGLGWRRIAGFIPPDRWRELRLLVPPAVPVVVPVLAG